MAKKTAIIKAMAEQEEKPKKTMTVKSQGSGIEDMAETGLLKKRSSKGSDRFADVRERIYEELNKTSNAKTDEAKEKQQPNWFQRQWEKLPNMPDNNWTDVNTNQLLLGSIPLLAGYALGDVRGGMIGGQMGLKAMKDYTDEAKQAEKQFFEQAARKKDLEIREKRAGFNKTKEDLELLQLLTNVAEKEGRLDLSDETNQAKLEKIMAEAERARAQAEAARVKATMNRTGKDSKIGGEKEGKQWQYESAGFARRMEASSDIMANLRMQGFDPTSRIDQARSLLPGEMQDPRWQQYQNAAKNWVSANLRKESGAVIGVDEMNEEVKKYFPQPGDKPEVVRQKAVLRQQAENGMKAAAGPTMKQVPLVETRDLTKQDPKIKAYADKFKIPYSQAAKIIEQRRKQKGGK